MTIAITAFDRSPDGGRGMGRDVRGRWALEELGLAYAVQPLSPAAEQAPSTWRSGQVASAGFVAAIRRCGGIVEN